MVKKKSLFDHINQITTIQNPNYWDEISDEDKKSWSNYMVNRFLSMKPEWIDLVNEVGTPIFATASGLVVLSDFSEDFGNFIILDHQNGYISHYYHNEENFVKKGDFTNAGDVIAKLGNTGMSTGPHLHFEIWKDGKSINPNTFFDDFNLKSDKLPK